MLTRLIRSAHWVTFTGVVALLVGLGWDAVLHRLDPGLAEREGVFNLSNPGHVLFAGGIAVVVAGMTLFLLGRLAGWQGQRAARRTLLAVPPIALVALAAVSFGVAMASGSSLSGRHTHTTEEVHVHDDGMVHNHEEHQAFVAAQGGASQQAGHDHGQAGAALAKSDDGQSRHQHGEDIPISGADLIKLQDQLVAARAGTEQYQDVRVALRDGFIQVTQDLPGIAAHFVSARYLADGVFDPAKPEILLYAKLDGLWKLVGLSYLSPHNGTETAPEGFAGPLDVWHYHTGLCFQGQRVISNSLDQSQCQARGGRFTANTGWMAHLWLYDEGPEGLFAHENSLLKGSGAVLTRADIAAMQ
jgi:hypothetical protein